MPRSIALFVIAGVKTQPTLHDMLVGIMLKSNKPSPVSASGFKHEAAVVDRASGVAATTPRPPRHTRNHA